MNKQRECTALMKVLVTGGSGLVGRAIQHVIEEEGGAKEGEEWIFLSSRDANLIKSVKYANKKYFMMPRNNIYINDNVLQAAHEAKFDLRCKCRVMLIFEAFFDEYY
ncbi:hypothetical protein XENOCAPTIV_009390 [Xenoophorus captivus]|uniref:Uncharacterized protein n=1 Tax=Xenoophorus captivus TaxID=1517983 RepID=A0ABV0QWL4_9TELE